VSHLLGLEVQRTDASVHHHVACLIPHAVLRNSHSWDTTARVIQSQCARDKQDLNRTHTHTCTHTHTHTHAHAHTLIHTTSLALVTAGFCLPSMTTVPNVRSTPLAMFNAPLSNATEVMLRLPCCVMCPVFKIP
jgi:hypothetical protein